MTVSIRFTLVLMLILASLCLSLPIYTDNAPVVHAPLTANSRILAATPRNNASQRDARFRPSIRDQCEADGFPFANSLRSFQCKSFNDLIGSGTSTATNGLASLANQQIPDPQFASIYNDVVVPIVNGLAKQVDSLSSIPPSSPVSSIFESNVCLGNFADFQVFEDYEGVCGTLPLDGEWTVLGFALDIGVGSPFNPLCTGVTDPLGTYASGCIALSLDSCSQLPSFAIALSTSIFSCTPFDKILAASTAGASVAVIKAVDVAFDSFTFGVSLSNAFRKEFKTFNGDRVISDFAAPGSFYMGGELALSPKSFSLPEVFELSGEASQMFGINADVTKVKSIVNGLTNSAESGATAVFDLVKGVDFSVLNTLVLNLKFCFSNLSKSKKGSIASALPDSDPFEIGSASLFATSYTVNSGNNQLKPGMYVYGSASPGNIIKGLVKYVLKFTGSILDFLPDWLPDGLKLDPSDLAEKIKISGTSDGDFAFGIAATLPDRIVLHLRVPLIISQLGFFQLRCTIDISDETFKCSVKTAFNEQIFGAVADAIEDGVLWVAKKLDKIGDDIADKGKEVLAVGLSTLGDAAEDVGSAFSKTTVEATAKAIEGGKVALSKLDDAAGEVASWAAKATGKFDDFMDDVGRIVDQGVGEVGRVGKEVINEAKDFFDDAQDELENAAKQFSSVMGCSVTAVVSTLKGQGAKCGKANVVKKTLNNLGRNVDKAFDEIGKTFANVAKKVTDAVGEALKEVFGVGNQKRKKVSVSTKKLSAKHSSTGCQLTEYTKVTRWEKRTCVIVCGKWKHDRTESSVLGRKPQDDCVKRVVQQVQAAMGKVDKVKPLEKKYKELAKSDAACAAAKAITSAKLVQNGLRCSTVFKHELGKSKIVSVVSGMKRSCRTQFGRKICTPRPMFKKVKKFFVPTTITCSVPQITIFGSLSSKTTVSKTKDVEVSTKVNITALGALKKSVIDEIVKAISTNCKAK